jgi:hypothetical protein
MKQIDIFADGRSANLTAFFHDQAIRKNPSEPNSASRMDFVTELLLEKRPPQFPGQKKTQRLQDRFHNCAPRLR